MAHVLIEEAVIAYARGREDKAASDLSAWNAAEASAAAAQAARA